MKNKDILRKIYYENRKINRNIQRLANVGLISLLAKAGLILSGVSEVLILVGDFLDYRKVKVEEKLEKCKWFPDYYREMRGVWKMTDSVYYKIGK